MAVSAEMAGQLGEVTETFKKEYILAYAVTFFNVEANVTEKV